MDVRRAAVVGPIAARAALALAIFGAALAVAYQGHWSADFRSSVPIPRRLVVGDAGEPRPLDPVTLTDYRMGVWAFSRHAYTWIHAPTQIFQTEPCHPVDHGFALHHPVLTQGLLAVPPLLVTGDPVATTNLLILMSALLAAGAMAVLVADWTGSTAAGIVAGLLWAFHPAQIESPFHLGTKDLTWTLLALFFARRLFDRQRWRDALGLAACGALQLGTSFYPLLVSALLALPVAVWLVWRRGWRKLPLAQLAVVSLIVAGVAIWLFSPYFALREAGVLQRNLRFFASWSDFAPGGALFSGWIALLLLLAAVGLGRSRALGGIEGDPRPALAVAGLLLALVATGGNVQARIDALGGGTPPGVSLPNLFALARSVVPGLDAIRLPSMLAHGTRMLLCLFAGLGSAALLRVVPRRWIPLAAGLLILAVFVETLRPAFLGMEPRVRFTSLEIRPDPARIAFFDALAEAGNAGPLLELPIDASPVQRFEEEPTRHLLSAYHHRRTSGCSPSYKPPQVREVAALARRLEMPGTLDQLWELGFTTLVVHHPESRRGSDRYAARIERLARRSGGRLERILEDGSRTAYALRGASGPE